MVGPGRREANKQQTRAALLAAARTMFAARAYDAVTVQSIAAAAHVTERTFFRYFATKDEILYADLLDLVPRLNAAVLARPADERPLAAFGQAVLDLASREGTQFALLFAGPPLLGRTRPSDALRGMLNTLETGLTDGMHARIGAAGSRYQAEVLTRAAVGALRTAMIAYHLAGGPHQAPPTTLQHLITEAFETLTAAGVPTHDGEVARPRGRVAPPTRGT